MQWSNSLSNPCLWSVRRCREQPCLIPWKCFSVCVHHCVSYRLISKPVLKLENTLSCIGSCSVKMSFFSLRFIKKKKRKLVFSLECKMLWPQLKSSRPRPYGQCLNENSPSFCFFFSQQNALLIGILLPPEEKCLVWKVLSDNSLRADLMHLCSFGELFFHRFFCKLSLNNKIWTVLLKQKLKKLHVVPMLTFQNNYKSGYRAIQNKFSEWWGFPRFNDVCFSSTCLLTLLISFPQFSLYGKCVQWSKNTRGWT